MALLIISIGTIEAFFAGVRVLLISSATNEERRKVWVRYARWLIAGLTFQLAADIIGTFRRPELGQHRATRCNRRHPDFPRLLP
jgi:uncharacterized membrane protein